VLEAGLALILVGVLGAAVAAVVYVPWTTLLVLGFSAVAVGLLVGVPTGFVYHLLLRSALRSTGPLPPRWWLRPFELHERVDPSALRRMRRWFMVGGLGFLLCVLGIALAALGLVAMYVS
jgi:hypothetical protein